MATLTTGPDRPAVDRRVWRVRGRADLQRLRRSPHRAHHGVVAVTWASPTDGGAGTTPPAAAFAVGRRVGGSVTRNRIRRRLRAALGALRAAGDLPDGLYLVSARRDAADEARDALLSDLRRAVARATGP